MSAHEGRRIALRRLCARAGYQVEGVVSRREALHVLAQGVVGWWGPTPDLIVVDQESLGDDAPSFSRLVSTAMLAVPVVVLSACGAADATISCLHAGAREYVHLPAKRREILEAFRRVLCGTALF